VTARIEDTPEKEETGFDEAYLSHARTLRTWFVAYGIGVPVLLLHQDKLLDKLLHSPQTRMIAACFLLGVAVQVATSIVYKAAMWHLYRAEYQAEVKQRRLYPLFEWVSEAFLLEFSLDVLTTVLFVVGTVKTIVLLGV
jgi:hypothetical protein